MRTLPLALPLIAFAALSCSPATSSDRAEPTANAATPSAVVTVAPAKPGIDSDAPPHPEDLATFGDWTVGCDNGRACQANALVPDDQDRDAYLLLLIERGAAPDAPLRAIVPLPADAPRQLALTVDGQTLAPLTRDADGTTATVTLDRARAARLADGHRVTLAPPNGKPIASASLTGLAATLLYIDDSQQRVGTTSAIRKPGPAASPAAPPLPTIATPAPASAPARTISVAAATKLIGRDNAVCDYAAQPVEPEAHRLDATHSLVLVAHPCGNGAYNMFSSAYVVGEDGKVAPARFDWATGMGPEGEDRSLVNADWDADTRRLQIYAKGRGLGDCGTISNFAWDGSRFRLIELRSMGECRGSIDYIRTWHAETRAR